MKEKLNTTVLVGLKIYEKLWVSRFKEKETEDC